MKPLEAAEEQVRCRSRDFRVRQELHLFLSGTLPQSVLTLSASRALCTPVVADPSVRLMVCVDLA